MHVLFIFISNFSLDFEDFKRLLCPHVPFYNPCMLFQSISFWLLFYNSYIQFKRSVHFIETQPSKFLLFSSLLIILWVLSLMFFFVHFPFHCLCVLLKVLKLLWSNSCFSKIKPSKKIYFFILLQNVFNFLINVKLLKFYMSFDLLHVHAHLVSQANYVGASTHFVTSCFENVTTHPSGLFSIFFLHLLMFSFY